MVGAGGGGVTGFSLAWWHVRTGLVIDSIFTGFGQAGAKRYGGYLKTSSIGGDDACHERGALFIGKAGSHYVALLYCETL